jgi:hypothetical protein
MAITATTSRTWTGEVDRSCGPKRPDGAAGLLREVIPIAPTLPASSYYLPVGASDAQNLPIVELLVDGIGATGWSRYSSWQQPGSRRVTASASGTLAAIPAPAA